MAHSGSATQNSISGNACPLLLWEVKKEGRREGGQEQSTMGILVGQPASTIPSIIGMDTASLLLDDPARHSQSHRQPGSLPHPVSINGHGVNC
ncbi:uncharacterized protein BO80DRAFT_429943 [Aspergillus ibericus CBS 121593]|uniref:Uncharacterized protein n=1 Tax=Aspergillus ibericus CBS 121593 TaxID=1448316 RepID=A0A395GJ83_9EURO|nr:hypothetical protein BO80DRAFT_429943 [Aspergillus ibericus CBS 121593]RAK95342.1 hypothetical protein BO80DRAFT_429943 [Aspergillus ibericus CBS 121593]